MNASPLIHENACASAVRYVWHTAGQQFLCDNHAAGHLLKSPLVKSAVSYSPETGKRKISRHRLQIPILLPDSPMPLQMGDKSSMGLWAKKSSCHCLPAPERGMILCMAWSKKFILRDVAYPGRCPQHGPLFHKFWCASNTLAQGPAVVVAVVQGLIKGTCCETGQRQPAPVWQAAHQG